MIARSRRRRLEALAAPARAGFTLVELIVAILILTVGILGLAGTSAVITRQMGGGSRTTVASTIAQSRFDSLASVTCTTLASGGTTSGTTSARGVTEAWNVVDGNDVKIVTDTVRIIGRRHPLVYKSIIPCRD